MYKFLCLLKIPLFLFATTALAQPESEIRLVITQPPDCTNNIMYVDIEVRAASIADTFRIGLQNYRFSFDSGLLDNPQIETELELSGSVIDGTNTLSIYSAHTLTGSLDTIVSYNIGFVAVGYLLTPAWVSVGRVSFDILNPEGCLHFIIHKSPTFPTTFIEAITPNGLITADIGNTQNLYACIPDFCTVPTEEIYEQAAWKIFPNPVSNQANVQLEHKNIEDHQVKVEVTNVSGKLIYSQILSDNSFSTTSLLPGMYMVQLKTDNWQSGVEKLVKLK